MSKTELEWLVAEATTVKPMIEKLEKDIVESEQLYKTIKPQRDQLMKTEIERGGGTLLRGGDPALAELMIQARDIERSQIEMTKMRRAYGHIIEQGQRAKKVLQSLPRETSVKNQSVMAAFQ
jgi:nucleoid-associated protein YgaU